MKKVSHYGALVTFIYQNNKSFNLGVNAYEIIRNRTLYCFEIGLSNNKYQFYPSLAFLSVGKKASSKSCKENYFVTFIFW